MTIHDDMNGELPNQSWDHPLVKLAFPANVSEAVQRIWSDRNRTLDLLDECPQTLCHPDCWPRNLFRRADANGGIETVAIDWAYFGTGAAGEDVANLFVETLHDVFLPATQHLASLSHDIYQGYLDGLTDAGAVFDLARLRFAFCAAASLKYVWGVSELLFLALDRRAQEWAEIRLAVPIHQLFRERGVVLRHLLGLAAEARALAARVHPSSR